MKELTDFEKFATNHFKHKHCMGCGGCILDRSRLVLESNPIWCISCRDRMIKSHPPGFPLPWQEGGFVND